MTMRHGNACTRHPRNKIRRDGRCGYCRAEAQRRYTSECRRARHRLREIEAVLAA